MNSKRNAACILFLVTAVCFMYISPGHGIEDITGITDVTREDVPGYIVRAIDGDTVIFGSEQQADTTVDLYGIDCPEIKQRYGYEAKHFIMDSFVTMKDGQKPMPGETSAKRISATLYKNKHNGRTVGVFYCGEPPFEIAIQEELLKHGLAWVSPQCDHLSYCPQWKELEVRAKAEKRGLWKDKNPVPPWRWRKIIRTEAMK